MDNDVNPSTIPLDDLKTFFTVIATDNEGQNLSSENGGIQFYLFLGEPLQNGSNYFEVRVLTKGGDLDQDLISHPVLCTVDVKTEQLFQTATVDRIEVTGPTDDVYTGSTTEEELRNILNVSIYYRGIEDPVIIRDYRITWDNVTQGRTVHIEYGSMSNLASDDSITLTLTDLVADSIKSVSLTDGESVPSSSTFDTVKNRLTVIAEMNDGKLHYLGYDDYDVTGQDSTGQDRHDFYTGADGADRSITLVITSNGHSKTLTVTVEPSEPTRVNGTLVNDAQFTAFTSPDPSVVQDVTVTFTSKDQFGHEVETDVTTTHYTVELRDTNGAVGITSLGPGSYALYIVYKENEKTVDRYITTVTVTPMYLAYPSVDQTLHNYTGSEQSWTVYFYQRFMGEAIIPDFKCPICKADENRGCDHIRMEYVTDAERYNTGAIIYATERGNYSVSFSINTANNPNTGSPYNSSYDWSSGSSQSPYSLVIGPGIPNITLVDSSVKGWTYGDAGYKPDFKATIGGGGESEPIDVTDQIDFDNLDRRYYRTASGGNGIGYPDSAGTWYVEITIPSDDTSNIRETTVRLPFEIAKDTLSVKAEDSMYTGQSQTPTLVFTGHDGDSVSLEMGTYSNPKDYMRIIFGTPVNVDQYTVRVILQDTINYTFAGDVAALSIDWNITPAPINKPTVSPDVGSTVETDGSITQTFKGDPYYWQVNGYDSLAMTEPVLDCSVHNEATVWCIEFDSENSRLYATDSGRYIASFSPDSNHKWSDDTEGAVTFTFLINQAELTVTAGLNAGSLVYGDNTPTFDSIESITDSYWVNFTLLGSAQANQVSFTLSTNYTRGSGVGSYEIYVDDFSSRNYTLQSTTAGTFSVNKAEITIAGIRVQTIVYLDSTPGVTAFSPEISGLKFERDRTAVESALRSTIVGDTTGILDYGTYDVTIYGTVSNYTIQTATFENALTVEKRGIYLDWSMTQHEYSNGDPPTVSVNLASNEGGATNNQFTGFDSAWTDEYGSTPSSFSVGHYTLTLTINETIGQGDSNYEWKPVRIHGDSCTIEGLQMTVPVEIIQDIIRIYLSEESYSWEYGGIGLDWLKTNLALEEGTAQEYVEIFNRGYSVIIGDYNSMVEEDDSVLRGLNTGPYTLRVVLDGTGDRLIYAEALVTISPYSISDIDITDNQKTSNYNGQSQSFIVQLPDIGLRGGMTATWTFTIDGRPLSSDIVSMDSSKNTATFSFQDADQYTINYSITAPNHVLSTVKDNQIVIDIRTAKMTVSFNDADEQTDEGCSATYHVVYQGMNNGSPVTTIPQPTVFGLGEAIIDFDDVRWTFTVDGESPVTGWPALMSAIATPKGNSNPYLIELTAEYDNYTPINGCYFTVYVDFATMTPNITVNRTMVQPGSTTVLYYSMESHTVSVSISGSNDYLADEIGRSFSRTATVSITYQDGSSETNTISNWTDFQPSNAGTYVISYEGTADNHNDLSFIFTIDIKPATIDITMMPSEITRTYLGIPDTGINGTAVSGVDSSTIEDWNWSFTIYSEDQNSDWIKIATPDTWAGLRSSVLNVGDYWVVYTVSLKNYIENEGTMLIHITPATLIPTVTDTSDTTDYYYCNSTYKGLSHSLGTNASVLDSTSVKWHFTVTTNGGVKEYGTWGDLLNGLVDANEYDISYTVSADNHGPAGGQFHVSIQKKPLNVAHPSITYGDDAPDQDYLKGLVSGYAPGERYSDVFGDGEIGINYERGNNACPTGPDGGYVITLPSLISSNYHLDSNVKNFEVSRFAITVYIHNQSTEYGLIPDEGLSWSFAQGMSTPIEGDHVFDFCLYASDDSGHTNPIDLEDAVLNRDTYTMVGSMDGDYNVTFIYDNGDHSTFTVNKRTVTASITSYSFVYNGKEVEDSSIINILTLSIESVRNDISLKFRYCGNGTDPGEQGDYIEGNPVNAGWYYVEATLSEDSNYVIPSDTSSDTSLYFQIARANYDVSISFIQKGNEVYYQEPVEGVFDGYTRPLYVDGSPLEGNVVTVGSDGMNLIVTYYLGTADESGQYVYKEYDGSPLTERGKYHIVARFTGSDNYNAVVDRDVFFEIMQAVNGWEDAETGQSVQVGSDGSLPSDYVLEDYDYTQSGTVRSLRPLFGTPGISYYTVADNGDRTKFQGTWDPSVLPRGTYAVVLDVPTDSNSNYTELHAEYIFTVDYLDLDPRWEHSTMPYVDGGVTNSLTGYQSRFMTATVQGDGSFDKNNGTMIGSDVGTYTVLLVLTDPNCRWAINPGSDTISLSWEITDETVPNQWVQVPSIRDWTFGETPSTPAGSSQYGAVVFTYYKSTASPGTANNTVPDQAGEYIMVATVEGSVQEGVSYGPLSAEVRFTIHRAPVALPEITTVEYTGDTVQSPFAASDLYTVSGQTSGKDIGEYRVTLSLTDDNHCWQDGTTGTKDVTWRIVHGGDLLEDYFAVDTAPEVYDGTAHEKSVVSLNPNLQEGRDYVVTYSDNLNAGTATITISAIGERASEPLTYHFLIQKASPVLEFVNEGFDRNEDQGTFTLLPYISSEADGRPVWSSSDTSVAIVDPVTGEVTLVGIGTATITATMPETANCLGISDSYSLNVGESQTEVIVVPGPGGSGGAGGDVIYIPTVITRNVDGGISDLTWLIILACTVVVMLAIIWLLWNRRVETQ